MPGAEREGREGGQQDRVDEKEKETEREREREKSGDSRRLKKPNKEKNRQGHEPLLDPLAPHGLTLQKYQY